MANANVNWWQYSRWGWVISRTMRMTSPEVTNKSYDYDIAEADNVAGTFKLTGNHMLEFMTGDTFTVSGSTGNDGAYVCTANATYHKPSNKTTITVAAVADGTDDGNITIVGREEAVVRRFLLFFWDEQTVAGTRPWLREKIKRISVNPLKTPGFVAGDARFEPVDRIVKMLQTVVRDLKKVPLTDAELPYVDSLFSATGNRRYGWGGNLI